MMSSANIPAPVFSLAPPGRCSSMASLSKSSDEHAVIDRRTLVPMGVMAAVLFFLGAAIWTSATEFYSMKHAIQSLQTSVRDLKSEFKLATDSRWKRTDMADWVRQFRELNPTIRMPAVHDR